MGKYKVKSGQNIFDVSLDIYGSIEGIGDLLINNEELSLNDNLKLGEVLVYSDDFVISPDVTAYNELHSIIPANSERNVYYKCSDLPLILEISVDSTIHYFEFSIKGEGVFEIDWNDNTSIEKVELEEFVKVSHSFNNKIAEKRKIRIYGNPYIKELYLNSTDRIYIFEPITIERVDLYKTKIELDFLQMVNGLYRLELLHCSCSSLLPLLHLNELMFLNLTGLKILRENLDAYLIGLAENYGKRRNCEVRMSIEPKGEYKEPERDDNGKYMIKSGMEAIWVIVNEESWNEGGQWKFIINDKIYCNE